MISTKIASKLFGIYELSSGTHISKTLRELNLNQEKSLDELNSLSLEKMSRLLSYAVKNSNYYKNKIQFDVDAPLKSFDILREIEFLDKSILRDNVEKIQSNNPTSRLTLAKTSGSTGMPLRFPKDAYVRAHHYAAMFRGHSWYNVDIGDREARLWGVPVGIKDNLKIKFIDFYLNRFREKDFKLTDVALNHFYESVLRHKPKYIMGYGKMLFGFALYLKNNKLSLENLNMKMAKYTSENLTDSDREIISDTFGCPVVSEYGAAETGIITFQCPEGGNHIMTDCVHVEFLDCPEISGKNVKELVVTDLNSLSFPVIRYRLGDLVEVSGNSCSCDLPFPVINKVIGRTSEIFSVGGGKTFHSLIFYYIVKGLGDVSKLVQFRVVQNSKINFTYQLCGLNKNDDIEKYLTDKTKQELGNEVVLTFEYLPSLPRDESGKLRDFVPLSSK